MINIDELKPQIRALAEKYGLSLVLLFGSHATGHVHKHSDVDIGYVSNTDIDYKLNYTISVELAQIFKHKDIEFTNIYNVSPSMKKEIANTGIKLYEKNFMIFDYFKINAFREYIDTKPFRKYRDSLIKDFIIKYA